MLGDAVPVFGWEWIVEDVEMMSVIEYFCASGIMWVVSVPCGISGVEIAT